MEGNIPTDVVKTWDPEITNGFKLGIDPARYRFSVSSSLVWLIRRNDGNIWVFLTTSLKRGGYVISKEVPFAQTSQLISTSSLKQAIEVRGKIAIQVNCATDQTAISVSDLVQQVIECAKR